MGATAAIIGSALVAGGGAYGAYESGQANKANLNAARENQAMLRGYVDRNMVSGVNPFAQAMMNFIGLNNNYSVPSGYTQGAYQRNAEPFTYGSSPYNPYAPRGGGSTAGTPSGGGSPVVQQQYAPQMQQSPQIAPNNAASFTSTAQQRNQAFNPLTVDVDAARQQNLSQPIDIYNPYYNVVPEDQIFAQGYDPLGLAGVSEASINSMSPEDRQALLTRILDAAQHQVALNSGQQMYVNPALGDVVDANGMPTNRPKGQLNSFQSFADAHLLGSDAERVFNYLLSGGDTSFNTPVSSVPNHPMPSPSGAGTASMNFGMDEGLTPFAGGDASAQFVIPDQPSDIGGITPPFDHPIGPPGTNNAPPDYGQNDLNGVPPIGGGSPGGGASSGQGMFRYQSPGAFTYNPFMVGDAENGFGIGTQGNNAGQDPIMQMLRSNLEPNLSALGRGESQYDLTNLFSSIDEQAQRGLDDQIAQLHGSAGSLGQRFGTAMARNEAQLRQRSLSDLNAQKQGLGFQAFEAAQGRRQPALNLMAQYGQGQQGLNLQAALANQSAANQAGQFNAGQQTANDQFAAGQGNIYNNLILQTLSNAAGLQQGQQAGNTSLIGLLAGLGVPQMQPGQWGNAIGDIGGLAMLYPFLQSTNKK